MGSFCPQGMGIPQAPVSDGHHPSMYSSPSFAILHLQAVSGYVGEHPWECCPYFSHQLRPPRPPSTSLPARQTWLRPCLLSPAGWLCAGRDLVIFNIRQSAWDTDLKRALKWLVLGLYKNTPEPDGVSSHCGMAGCSSVLLV